MNLLTLSELKAAPLPTLIVDLVAERGCKSLSSWHICVLPVLHTPVFPFQFHLIPFSQPSYPQRFCLCCLDASSTCSFLPLELISLYPLDFWSRLQCYSLWELFPPSTTCKYTRLPCREQCPFFSIMACGMVCAWVFLCVMSGLVFEAFLRMRGGAQHHVPGECLALGCVEWIPASECQTRRLPVRMSGVLSALSRPHLTLNNSSLGMETNQGLKTIWSLWMGFGGCEHQGIMCTSVVWTGV